MILCDLKYRYDPDKDKKPYLKDYDIDVSNFRMLLDALIHIKSTDDSLSLRRSCREGVCGSDAMNINGKNGLACITKIEDLKEPVVLRPLPGLPVIRDLVVDMSQFFKQFHSVKPYLNHQHLLLIEKEFKHLRIEANLMVYMNAFFVRVVQLHVRPFGGTQTNLLVQLDFCKLTDFYLILEMILLLTD